MSMFNMRLDDDLKNEVLPVFESYGLTMPQAIKLFLNQVAKTKAVPLNFDYNQEQATSFNEQTLKAFKRTDDGKELHSAKDLIDLIKQLES